MLLASLGWVFVGEMLHGNERILERTMISKGRIRVRRSFGGKEGIWWRKQRKASVGDELSSEAADCRSKFPSILPNSDILGWDPILCRPIYKEVISSSSDGGNDEDSDDDLSSSGKSENDEGTNPNTSTNHLATHKPSIQRRRSYATRKRPILFFIDVEDAENRFPTKTKTLEDMREKGEEKHQLKDSKESRPLFNSAITPPSTPSAVNTFAPRLISGKVEDGEKQRKRGRLNLQRDTLESVGIQNLDGMTKRKSSRRCYEADAFDFNDDKAEPGTTRRRKALHQPGSNTSLVEARSFFELLDATEELKVDSSDTPVAPSRVVRTSRPLSITSPGIQREYQNYATASRESEVSPLSIQAFAVNRAAFFRKSEIYDGFLDE